MALGISNIQYISAMEKLASKKKKKKLTQKTKNELMALGVSTAGIETEEQGKMILNKVKAAMAAKNNKPDKSSSLISYMDLIAQTNKNSLNL